MIEARVRSYFQITRDDGEIIPAISVDGLALDDMLLKRLEPGEQRRHLLLEDETTGVTLLEIEIDQVRFRIPLEAPPAGFVGLGRVNGFAVCPSNVGPGVRGEYLHVGPFSFDPVAVGGVAL